MGATSDAFALLVAKTAAGTATPRTDRRSKTPSSTFNELHAALDAEATDETTSVDELRSTTRAATEYAFSVVQPLKAHVKNGRLVLDEPTDLPEGEVVELVPADTDDMDDDERAALHESLAVSIDQMKNGQLIDGEEVLARLRARR